MSEMGDVGSHFRSRKLAAFAWLGALRHLDFQFVRLYQVLGGDTKPRRGHLLDAIACLRLAAMDLRVLATLSRVATRPQAVHGDRKSTRLNSSHVRISYAVFC